MRSAILPLFFNPKMRPLQERLSAAEKLLMPYAIPLAGAGKRTHAEPEDDTRFPFQRDRGRIIHAQAFRRLQGKTQVFVAGEGDHFRTRLTHTLEVAELSRDMARALLLNEDLAECIALTHDLGHPPFAHMGERALDLWMRAQGSHFEHNEQSLRTVTMLEEHSTMYRGLNLNQDILEGMQKHGERKDRGGRALSLEAQLVNMADEISYSAHDSEDGLRAGLFALEDALTVPLIRRANDMRAKRETSLRGAIIQILTTDLYAETERRIQQGNVRTLDDVFGAGSPLVELSAEMRTEIDQLHEFLNERMYGHPRVTDANREGQAIITALCEKFFKSPPPKVLALQTLTGSSLADAVKDYVAGMTDGYARMTLTVDTSADM